MGYYTKFSMECRDAKTREVVSKELEREIALCLYKQVFITDFIEETESYLKEAEYPLDLLFEEELKWYTCQEDMEKVSLNFPDIVFDIDGYGEDREDIWEMAIRNGKSKKRYVEIRTPTSPIFDFFD